MNKNKFLVWSKWTNEKDTGMFGVWTYWRKRIIKKRNLSTAGFLLKKKVYNRTISVAYILSYSAFENRFAIKKNDKTHVCCIMFKIYNFKTLSSFNLLLNKKRGGGSIRIFVVKLTFHLSHRKSHVPRWTKFKMFSSQGFDLHGNVFGNC